ncbi:MAG: hypothetical protein QXL69_06780, partial [Candidatus Bathyarchaeia archaeon]
KKIDNQGRISIPIQWRSEWKSNKVVLIKHKDKIEIMPIEITPPSSLFDSIKISENADFLDSHSIKRALLELKES